MNRLYTILSALLFIQSAAYGQAIFPYKNASLPVDERVKDLLQRMTPEEKFWQLFMVPGEVQGNEAKYKNGIFGLQLNTEKKDGNAAEQIMNHVAGGDALALVRKVNSIQKYFVEQTRLGIPVIVFDEGLHGLSHAASTDFPQAIALAATWDTALVRQVSKAIATEARIRGLRDVLSPVINIASDVRWGRTEETYGEDPYLASEMAVAFISPFEKMGVITTPKHFIANVGDGGRDSYPVHADERYLDEICLPPFKAAIQRGGARSVMTAYNSLDGIPCGANSWLLTTKLKDEWGFKGFVISDAGAVGGANVLHYTSPDYPTSGQQAITAGLDVIFQTSVDHYTLFIPPFLNGAIDSKRIDDAVSRVLRAKFELGLFDNPYVDENEVHKWDNDKTHKAIAKQAALESITLLKNAKHVLPLSKNVQSIAVIGVDAVEARPGGYSGPGNGKVNILDGIKNIAGNNIKVTYQPGCGRISNEYTIVPSEYLSHTTDGKTTEGLQGEYFNNITLEGNAVVTRTDKDINYNWTLFPPDPALNPDFYSVRWTGKIHAPQSGTFKIGLDGNDGFRLYIDNKLVIDNWNKQTYSTKLVDFAFEKDKQYDIRIEFYEPVSNAHIKLIWNIGVSGVANDWQAQVQQAVDNAAKADVAIVVVGIEEGEFRDRASLDLPGHQQEMIQRIAATGKSVIVVLVGGSAVTMSAWIDKVDGIVDVWYPGDEGGNALADVLFGKYNPAGRLPITFPISVAQVPLVYNHKPTGRGDDYNNLSGLPLFPFGYGLSYTTFEYSDIHLDKKSMSKTDSTIVRFKIKNTGTMEGDEVVQLYIHDLLASVARPVMELKGFQRIHLMPGESKEVLFIISPAMLSMLNKQLQTVVEPGDFRIMIGASSRDLRLKETLTVKE